MSEMTASAFREAAKSTREKALDFAARHETTRASQELERAKLFDQTANDMDKRAKRAWKRERGLLYLPRVMMAWLGWLAIVPAVGFSIFVTLAKVVPNPGEPVVAIVAYDPSTVLFYVGAAVAYGLIKQRPQKPDYLRNC